MYNAIRLIKGERFLAKREWEKFEKGDTVFGIDIDPVELKKWTIDQKEEAQEELSKYRCEYWKTGDTYNVREYALEYFEEDEDGEFECGSDYNLAEEAEDETEDSMKIYFSNNTVIITDGITAKLFDAAPSGIYEGVDLCSVDAAKQLRNHFRELEKSGELNDFCDIYSKNEMDLEDLEEEIEAAECVFEK